MARSENAERVNIAVKINRKVMPLFFLIDVSGSMRGSRIQAVNVAMRDVVRNLRELAKKMPSIQYEVRILTFGNNSAMWKYGTPEKGIPLEEYEWVEIRDSECEGRTPMGECISLLKEVMAEDTYKSCLGSRICAPFVLLLSDGLANGKKNLDESIYDVHNSYVGKLAHFVAIGIALKEETAVRNLQKFGVSGMVSADDDPAKLAEFISLITSSSIQQESKIHTSREDMAENVRYQSEEIYET